MKKIITIIALFASLTAGAQQADSFFKHTYLPVVFGASFCTTPGIGGAFYMRACLEYRFDVAKGLFVAAEFDTRTHPFSGKSIYPLFSNVDAGDAAFTDLLIGPGWRFSCSDSFKIALSLQGGASNIAMKQVAAASEGFYNLKPLEFWRPAAKVGVMLEYYLNPAFDLFVSGSMTTTQIPYSPASMDPFVLFPTVCVGFSMALES